MKLRSTAVVAGLAMVLMSGAAQAAIITFGYTGDLQSYTITSTGTYDIIAFGAQGGAARGGRGAEIGGDFRLTAGDQLVLAVGGRGESSTAAGGGGGTFVVTRAGDPLLIAGGGGGGGAYGDGGDGLSSQDGGDSLGASGGSGGSGGQSGGAAGGGGGFLGAGQSGQGVFAGIGGGGYPDLTGGASGYGGAGGFGGGGGGSIAGGGGGGGYSGGAGSDNNVGFGIGGGGGGSFLSSLALSDANRLMLSGTNDGDGFVTLELVSAVPLPAAAPMFGAALLSLAGIGYAARRKRSASAA